MLPNDLETESDGHQSSIEYDILQMIDSDRSFSAERQCVSSNDDRAGVLSDSGAPQSSGRMQQDGEPFNFNTFKMLLNQRDNCEVPEASLKQKVGPQVQESLPNEFKTTMTLKLSSSCFVPSASQSSSNGNVSSTASTEGDSVGTNSFKNSRETSQEPQIESSDSA